MFDKTDERPKPGSLFYPGSGLHPSLGGSWFLTVNERFPEKDSLYAKQASEIYRRIRNRSIDDSDSVMRTHLYAFDSEGGFLYAQNMSDEALARIAEEVLKGKYHGRTRKDDCSFSTGKKYFDVFHKRERSDNDKGRLKSRNSKPRCRLSGEDGNIFNLISVASKALERTGQRQKAKEMQDRIFSEARDYEHAIRIIMEYVEVD